MTACILKIAAVITMVIDHTGAIFFDGQEIWRMIGRIAMPLYAFMIVEGVRHTAEKPSGLKRYLFLLMVLAVLSEPAYDYAFEGVWADPLEQNQILQFATFVLAFMLARSAGAMPIGVMKKPLQGAIWVLVIAVNSHYQIGYMGTGIVFLLMLYWYAEHREGKSADWRALAAGGILVLFFTLLYMEQLYYLRDAAFVLQALPRVLMNDVTGKMVLLAVPFLALYNGEYGDPPRWLRMAYRYFYPAHLYLLGFLAAFWIR